MGVRVVSVIPQAQTPNGGSMEWRTPRLLFDWLNSRFGFEYDAFASHDNALCGIYSTIEGTYGHSAGDPLAIDPRDGLDYPWSDWRVFLNPPYSRGLIEKCVRKAHDERNNASIIVALLPAATESKWFQRFIIEPRHHIEWLPRRVRFINPETGEPGNSPTTGHVVVIFRPDPIEGGAL